MQLIISGRVRALAAAAGACLALAACATSQSGTASPGPAGPASGPASAAAPAEAAMIDCSFLTAAQVKALIGASPTGHQQPEGCTWEDPETYKSVTIEVSATGTAPGGKLPEWDPAFGPERTLPGGMRDINGAVQFVCGGTRLCQVQVATAGDAAGDQAKALDLVDRVRAKVG